MEAVGSAVHQLFVIEECVEYLLYLDEEGICPVPSFRRNWCISSVAALPANVVRSQSTIEDARLGLAIFGAVEGECSTSRTAECAEV